MKRYYIALLLLLPFTLFADGAEAQSRFKQIFQRKNRIPKEQVLKHVKIDSVRVIDSAKLAHIVAIENSTPEKVDSTTQTTINEKPYNPYLNLTLTPKCMDSLIASWNESQNARAFDKFFADYIAIDSLSSSSASLPDSVYESRLRALASPVQLPYNPIVKRYIDRYTDTRYGTINRIMSLSQYYFPIIEEELLRAELPVELRAMPIIESALAATAVSPRGATGLWQFMPYTGKSYGLEVNSLVDERRDAVLSTRAACKYLRDLYKLYNDWTLAIAAYNCGPGNVNKALARAGAECKTFWDIYYFLPPETRGYVPAFIGATYAYNYHRQHGIEATPSPLPLATDTIHLNRIMHFEQVSSTIKTPIDVIRSLNPQYRLDIVPAVSKTYTLTLPRTDLSNYLVLQDTIMAKDTMYLAQYLKPTKADPSKQEFSIESYTYTVKKGDVLGAIARREGVTVKQLMQWNNIKDASKLRIGQKLEIYR